MPIWKIAKVRIGELVSILPWAPWKISVLEPLSIVLNGNDSTRKFEANSSFDSPATYSLPFAYAIPVMAKAADLPLCVLLGGSVGPVKAYNSNGLWLQSPESAAAEAVELLDERGGGFRALKLRLGRADPRDDLATIKAVWDAIGDNIDLMFDFN